VVVSEEPTRKLVKRLKKAGFVRTEASGSHGRWQHRTGPVVFVPDGHRTISPGVVRQVNDAIAEALEKEAQS
jgi:predicted RNA binding protein YcfA (HicA-like mRNA interferase family)